jgi:hypothetical protein
MTGSTPTGAIVWNPADDSPSGIVDQRDRHVRHVEEVAPHPFEISRRRGEDDAIVAVRGPHH